METLALHKEAERLQAWLFESALPLWFKQGLDHKRGGCFESLNRDGSGTHSPRRGRLHPRMIFAFCEAGKLGWNGDWRYAALHAYHYFIDHYQTNEGHYANLVSQSGQMLDPSFDLYNQAFALLGFARINEAVHEREKPAIRKRALELLEHLTTHYSHRSGGFKEHSNRSTYFLRSNPHMHLLEAMLAWEEEDPEGPWAGMADDIAGLAFARFYDGATGLGEYFTQDWRCAKGRDGERLEPGHHYEWAWLLTRWGRLHKDASGFEVATQLHTIAETHGLDPTQTFAIMAMDRSYRPMDPTARLWAQAERLKASLLLSSLARGTAQMHYRRSSEQALQGLLAYLEGMKAGLWKDRRHESGRFAQEPVPASSFYHIIGVLSQLTNTKLLDLAS
ncbi:AGE family epimerase/isomerase [Flexibacterium corallicola]|uniref:AGE family epimerase/isomerase n=1 Tax=Flexibacterium corallicola TaxID=3037259 RepID=UPI00286F2FBA|nr:AGE family epimerase/isomerase [Pseudovibrio sp. M1P-2-3]